MEFMIRPRQRGKTLGLVDWLREDPDHRVIITASAGMAATMRRQHDLTGSQVVAADSVTSIRGRRAEYAVDDLDLVLPVLLGTGTNPVSLVTATGTSR